VVVAAAPGLVTQVAVKSEEHVIIFVQHTEYKARPTNVTEMPDGGLLSSYQHLAAAAEGIVPGAVVSRGQPIGYLNADVHLHFDIQFRVSSCAYRCYIDPYRDLFHDEFAAMEHDSGYGYPIWVSWGSPGLWTADNRPFFGKD
jgi:murein DD-endopeptidase MepM/ murein hydrolase activator NlpD